MLLRNAAAAAATVHRQWGRRVRYAVKRERSFELSLVAFWGVWFVASDLTQVSARMEMWGMPSSVWAGAWRNTVYVGGYWCPNCASGAAVRA